MYVPAHFAMAEADLRRVLAEVGFVDLVTADEQGRPAVTPLPVVYDPEPGEWGTFRAHLALPNTQWQHTSSEALVVLRGGDAYISALWYPSYHIDQRQVPTWDYEVVHAYGTMTVRRDHDWLLTNVREISERFDTDYDVAASDAGWIDRMLRSIVGVEIAITTVEGKAKLSQNKPVADVTGVIDGLTEAGRPDMADRVREVALPHAARREAAVEAARAGNADVRSGAQGR